MPSLLLTPFIVSIGSVLGRGTFMPITIYLSVDLYLPLYSNGSHHSNNSADNLMALEKRLRAR